MNAHSSALALPAIRTPTIKTHVALLDHAQKAGALQGNLARHAMDNVIATAHVVALGIDSQTVAELLELQQSAWQRFWALQSTWQRQWKSWSKYADQVPACNTLSKLYEREGNVVGQFLQLITNQTTDLMSLQENIEVSYRYWIGEKLAQKQQARSVAA